MTIKTVIKNRREALGLTQEAAAGRIGKSKQQWEQWEAGVREPGLKSLYAIAKALETEPAELLK